MQKRLNRSRCRLGLTRVDPMNSVVEGGSGSDEYPFASARGDKAAMRPIAQLL